ncbi:MAG: ABC transporter substrate-binding protein [Firmicutes bacterium]|nr:ABC transporter substrate-binding protein [Bacillota bacterium]MBQ4409725.1 ABC transporter substrate-binding protein [Bacillota bacterium]MBR0210349.1 ABC transporter substrate-binding protein [Bacillota bacterium]MBR3035186.1 ABC transporter substrate-binding protein [Bacillota bacterium]MBR6970548.1 ABC transporter substrate-binding protein [Bacillota bacterium]
MKNVRTRKWVALLLSAVLVLSVLAGCTSPAPAAPAPDSLSSPLNVGTLMGPTGMGMAGLFGREDEGFQMNLYDAPDQCMAGLLNGDLDVAAIPSNVAAVLYNKTEGGIRLLGVNTGGVLYVLSNNAEPVSSLADLKGKTVYASGMGGVPEYAFKALMEKEGLAESDVELIWMNSHADVVSTLISQGGYALVPEPQVTVAGTKADTVKVDLDINAMWKESFGYDLPMGVIACRAEIADNRADDLGYFLQEYNKVLEGYNADKDAAAETIANAGILPAAGVAKAAMPRCNIMLETGIAHAKDILTPLYETLFSFNPQSVGGSIPGDDFYFNSAFGDYSIRLEF